jgi:beta-N-acetylhexosaminidase
MPRRGHGKVAPVTTTLQDQVGQLLVVGLPGPTLDPIAREMLLAVRPAGVILFSRNIEDSAQTAELCRQVRELFSPDPFLVVDQEGGRVSRLSPPFPRLPTAAHLGRLEMASIARWFGALTGRGLRCLGFHADYAPVVDLARAGDDDGIGDRSFSPEPAQATVRAAAFLTGLEEAGVLGCLKHFPGLGGAPGDTHEFLPRMPVNSETRTRGILPYRELAAISPMVMVAHAHYPDLSGETPLPASLDRRVVFDLLRQDVGYTGVIVSDDLEMGAVADHGAMGRLAVATIAAGCDQALVCHLPERIYAAWEGLRQAVDSGDLDHAELESSLQRIAALKAQPAMTRPVEPFDPEDLRAVVDEMQTLTEEVESALSRQTS